MNYWMYTKVVMKKMFGESLCITRRTEETTGMVCFFIFNELFTRLKTKQKTVGIHVQCT